MIVIIKNKNNKSITFLSIHSKIFLNEFNLAHKTQNTQ